VFYYEDDNGTHRSIFGHSCKRFSSHIGRQFHGMLQDKRESGRRIFESDINPIFRVLADHYIGATAPQLHLGFFDIEVSFDKERGFAPPSDPFNYITAITLYRSADQRLLTFTVKPDTLSKADALTITQAIGDCRLCDTEEELLRAFLDAIEDVDLLTGWSSSAYDIPYLVNRIRRVISIAATKCLCLWDQTPSPRHYTNKFGRHIDTYDLIGRVHIDYLDLYAKHNQQQRLSYALNSIGEIEVGETKVSYEGTLDDLYNNEYEKFLYYNRQDVLLMVKIDQKLRYIDLANQIAHANCVLFKTTMGSVALVEQAIINEIHAVGCVVPDRKSDEDTDDDPIDEEDEEDGRVTDEHIPVVGAYVAQPKGGLHEYVGAMDINSLYPSAIRALNMSPETLFGQVRLDETLALVQERTAKLPSAKRAESWDGLFCTCEMQHMHDQDDTVLTVDFFDHLDDSVTTRRMTGKQLHKLIFNDDNQLCITANGTIFRTDIEGMIPALLTKWYAERKDMQKQQHKFGELAAGLDDEEARLKLEAQAVFWNQRQQARKILLNATYGAMLNETMRFADKRLGQSTTLSGRSIVRHMGAKINEIITGHYDLNGEALVAGDTDSAYFSAYQVLKDDPAFADVRWTKENIIVLYDQIAEETNQSFAEFMQSTFHTTLERGNFIKAGRELIASKALFIKKKKYACLMFDKEGERLDVNGKPGKLKVMGLDLKRADTPKVMQTFLENLLMSLLTDVPQEQMFADIKAFRQAFKDRPAWEKGTPKKVSNLSVFADKLNQSNKKGLSFDQKINNKDSLRINMPGHVRASLNWNWLCDIYGDRYATRITDSSRIIVCKLRANTMGMTSIAYPMDETHLPPWFRELPFDDDAMEEGIIDQKIMNLVGVLKWDLGNTKIRAGENLFSFN